MLGSLNLVQALEGATHTPDWSLIASRAIILGDVLGDPINETFPIALINHCAASGAAMESPVRTWFNRLPIVVTRPFNYTDVVDRSASSCQR